MRILFIVGRELSYQRNEVLLRAFQRFGQLEIVGTEKYPRSLMLNSLIGSLRAIPRLIFGRYDLIFVGFYGHLLMLPAGILARTRRIPILFDVFISNYDTLVDDRQTISPRSITAQLAAWLDRTACNLADHLLIDTQLHADFFTQRFSIPPERISVVPVGCNEDIFNPRPPAEFTNKTQVLYYCTYLPLHGAHVVIKAANLLKKENIFFHLIGTGPEYPRVHQLAEHQKLENVRFTSFVPLKTLRDEITRAEICLGGHFGTSAKAARVVPGKIYQLLAMACPVIAADSPANQELLTHTESAFLIPPNDPFALADAIHTLHQNPTLRAQLAQSARVVYENQCSEAFITSQLESICKNLQETCTSLSSL